MSDTRRMQGCCFDCGRRYGDEYGFPDLVVSHEVWSVISPFGDEGGLLCPSCMCRRAHLAGLSGVTVTFTSGPFEVGNSATVAAKDAEIAALKARCAGLAAALKKIRDGHCGDQTAEAEYVEAQKVARAALTRATGDGG